MTLFDDREKAFETQFKLNEEQQFRIAVHCAKRMGMWAAARFGLTGDEAEAYARTVVLADMAAPGHFDLLEQIRVDAKARDMHFTPEELALALAEAEEESRRFVMDTTA